MIYDNSPDKKSQTYISDKKAAAILQKSAEQLYYSLQKIYLIQFLQLQSHGNGCPYTAPHIFYIFLPDFRTSSNSSHKIVSFFYNTDIFRLCTSSLPAFVPPVFLLVSSVFCLVCPVVFIVLHYLLPVPVNCLHFLLL